VQAAGIGKKVVKEHLVNGFAVDLFKVFGSRFIDEVGGGNSRETIGGAGPTTQTIIKWFFELFVPFQAPFDKGTQQRQSSAGDAGFMTRRTEYRTGNLAKPTFIALRNRVVVFSDIHKRHPLKPG
jgi:hypothetical protein